eukprot:11834488-Ditylum_brightwellii.AAC.1
MGPSSKSGKHTIQWQRLMTLPNAKLRSGLDKGSDLPLDEIWKSDVESEHLKDLANADVNNEKCISTEERF